MSPLVAIENLSVDFATGAGTLHARVVGPVEHEIARTGHTLGDGWAAVCREHRGVAIVGNAAAVEARVLLLPLRHALAHRIGKRLSEARRSGEMMLGSHLRLRSITLARISDWRSASASRTIPPPRIS